MINTDTTYNTLIASGSYEESITGTLKDGSGTTVLNISNEYIKTGSLIIDNKCINNDDLEPGAVYAAELKITITGNAGLTSSQKSSLQNGSLNLTYTITDGDSSSSISIGIYYIIEVTLKDEDVEIIAEDMMSRLSKNIPTAVREDLNFVARTPYELLDLCCQNCSTSKRPISLANDETEFDSWSNADTSFLIPTTADIATYRDLVAEVAKIMGCFATIDKATNGLILKRLNPHSNSNVWTLNEDIRYSTEKSGYVCLFGKVSLGNVSYPTTSDDDVSGLILSMRASELTDDSELLPGIVQNLYNEMAGISYRPCKIEFMGNIALEVGDWIGVNYTEDETTYTFRTIITHLNWILNGKELIESTGSSAATTKKVGSKGSGESRNSSSIDNLTNRIETLESSSGGKEILTSTADPSIADGNNDNIWFKYTLEAGLKFDNGATYPDWHYMGCFRGEYTGYGEGWCYVWANNYPIPQDVNTGEGYVFPFLEYNAGYRILKLGIRCHKDRYEQIVDTAAVTFYVISKGYPTGQYFTGKWMYCDMDANYQQYFGINLQISLLLFGVALIVQQSEVSTTREYVAIDGVSTLTNIAKRTNAEWVKINGEWVLVSEDIGSEVIVTPTLTEGTEIGEIEVSGNSKKLYAPTPQSVSASQSLASGTEVGSITVDDTTTTLYAPTPQSVSVTQTLASGTEIGSVTIDDITTTLYAPTGGGGGSTVTVTPITTTGTNIADIEVDGTTYQLFAPSGGGSGSEVKRSIDWDNKVDITLPYTATADGYFFFRIYQAKCQVTINGVNIISQAESDREVSGSGIYPISTGDVLRLDFGTAPGTMWFVPLKETGKLIETALVYSNEERVVGVWTDNRPLYQKTYTYSFTASSNDYDYNITTLSSEVNTQYIETDAFYRDGILFKEVIYPPGDIFYRYVINGNVLSVRVLNSSGSTVEGTVTVRYTKTTDAPGSGTYITSGAYAHHYSTTEQVVGTWIDGKPIYEITYELATTLTINSTSYIHSGITPANIKSLIGMSEIIDVRGQSAPIVAGLYSNGEIALAALNTVYSIDLKYLIVRFTKTTD